MLSCNTVTEINVSFLLKRNNQKHINEGFSFEQFFYEITPSQIDLLLSKIVCLKGLKSALFIYMILFH